MDRLDFKLRKRLKIQPPGARMNSAMDGYRQSKTYIDFIVNGNSLADLFDVDKRDLVSMLSVEDITKEHPVGREIFNYFKRSGTLIHELTFQIPCRYEFRRVHIYGCPECGDLGCGSVTMQMIEKADTVLWQRFDDGREEYANYMSSDKSYTDGQLFEIWQKRNRDYSVLDAFSLCNIEMDYEYCYELKSGKISLDPDADIYSGDSVVIDFPEIGPFEFDKDDYLRAFKELKEIKY